MPDAHALATAPAPERDAADRLQHLGGPGELHAVLLALLLPRGGKRPLSAWRIEAGKMPGADALREHAANLSGAARLPWFELLLARMATQPVALRRQLLHAARRIMGARGVARPIDRLHWLVMRRALGDVAPLAARPEPHSAVLEWLESDVLNVAAFTAFLSRMVPGDVPDAPEGRAWYDAVMANFPGLTAAPPWQPPDAETMVDALTKMQTLSWMQRPVVVRTWIQTAIAQSRFGRLSDLAADALRMSCTLLDAPLPPELARHYIALAADGGRPSTTLA